MLNKTKIYLDGAMGAAFGGEWNLFCRSPGHALRLIDANKPGLFAWIRGNNSTIPAYRVVIEHRDGRIEECDADTVVCNCDAAALWFIPVLEGSKTPGIKMILGAALIVASFVAPVGGGFLFSVGVSMFVGGAVQYLTKQKNKNSAEKSKNSYSSDLGDVAVQGDPVPLIYGRAKVGARTVSVDYTVLQTDGSSNYSDK